MDNTIVITVIITLLLKECQKLVTFIASLKLLMLNCCGNDKAPEISLVISDGCLKAIIIVIYNGKNTVKQPKIKITVKNIFVPPIFLVFIIVVPPFY